jgi:hypothetical protein
MENSIRIKIEDVEFEAKGDATVIAQERAAFIENVLPLISGRVRPIHHQQRDEDLQNKLESPKGGERVTVSEVLVPQIRKTKKAKSFAPQLVKDLNLRGDDKVPSFKSFYEEKKPKMNIHITALAVYYLSKILHYDKIDANAIYTCYKELPVKVPENIPQNLRDTSRSRYGFIDYKDDICTISVRGENLIEKDLPSSK